MTTCLGDAFAPSVARRAADLLGACGVAVDVPRGQTCCGLPLFNSGYRAEAARVARRTLGLFRGPEPVVVPSGSCAWMLRHEYPGLLASGPEAAAARALADRTWELSQFLVNALGRTRFAAAAGGRLAYHDSCHLLRGLGERRAPRVLLAGLAGAEAVPLDASEECCGFGGSFAVRLPEISGAVLERKLDHVEASGADRVVACDAGCLLQLGGGLRRRGSRVRAVHLAEVLGAPLP